MADPARQTWEVRKAVVRSRAGLVAAQHVAAAEVGARVLADGGNAIDAALATSLAISVLEPWGSGLGGGGFMLVARSDGAPPVAFDFGMRAPAALDSAAYPLVEGQDVDLFGWPAVLEGRNVHGPLAIAAPGQAAGLDLAWRELASWPWADLVAPAIALAERGLPVSWYTTLRVALAMRDLARYEAARAVYLPDNAPPLPEAGPRQLGPLAETLRHVAETGARDLVDGALARALVEDVRAAGGVLTLDDLRRNEARIAQPIAVAHGDATVLGAPGLSAGPTLAHALELIRGRVAPGAPGPAAYLAWAEALFAAYEQRLATMGAAADPGDPGCTTHLCVVDRDGTMVSLTQTLLSLFGARVVSPQTGILLNNGIMWFDPRPGRPNSLAAGRRPLANMCPMLALQDGRPWWALGGSGGRKILPAVLQLASMLIDGGLDLESALHTPRIDVSGEPHVSADRRLPAEVRRALAARYRVVEVVQAPHPNAFACPTAVLREPSTGVLLGMTDPIHPHAGVPAA